MSATVRGPRRGSFGLLFLFFIVLLGAALLSMPVAFGQQHVSTVSLDPGETLIVDGIEVLPVQGKVYMLVGGGANVAVQIGQEGVVVVDTGAAGQSRRIIAAIRRLTNKPIRTIINTSADPDHVAGNAAFVEAAGGPRGPGTATPLGPNAGAEMISTEGAYNKMLTGGPGRPEMLGDALPRSTFFTPRKDIYSNGEGIALIFQPRAHTDGDLMAHFRASDVVVTGDVFNTTSYPVIDTAQRGTVNGVIAALNTIIELTIPERNQMGGTRVIPGHGRISNEADVVDYRDMVTIIRDRIRDAVNKGMTLEQVKAAKFSLEYDGIYGATTGPWTTDMFTEAIFREMTALRPPPPQRGATPQRGTTPRRGATPQRGATR
ncbi:MAG: MBL fold metallo-hydrolase [Vicinamibacterales bacterium]